MFRDIPSRFAAFNKSFGGRDADIIEKMLIKIAQTLPLASQCKALCKVPPQRTGLRLAFCMDAFCPNRDHHVIPFRDASLSSYLHA
jgi:hypothetical protein